jgi:arginase
VSDASIVSTANNRFAMPRVGQWIDIVCIPTEAGTHFSGQCKAPGALVHGGGLGSKLLKIGYNVAVHEHVLTDGVVDQAASWKPSAKINGVRNEKNTLDIMTDVHRYLLQRPQISRDRFPIVLGGDCSITPAVFSAFKDKDNSRKRVGLLYFDGDADLTLPSQTNAEGSSAIIDSMTISHLTGREGGLPSMSQFRSPDGSPLVNPDNIVLFGFDPLQPATEHWIYLVENQFKVFTRPTVRSDPAGYAKKALEWLSARADIIYVHFDVDVIDSGEFPLANYPHYAGLMFDEAMAALKVFLGNEKVKGLTVTEVNPNNDPSGQMVQRLVDGIVDAMDGRPS